MKIPDNVKICGFNYKIILKKLENPEIFGQCSMQSGEILLCSETENRQKVEETFIHEVTHCINDTMETKFTEGQITAFSRVLYQVLNDNNLLKD